MAKYANDDIMDAALNVVINNASTRVACSGQPASYSDATTLASNGGNKLGSTSIASGDFTGPVDGDTSGRKLTVPEQTGVAVDEDGDVDHEALVDDGNSRLLHVTTVPTTSVTTSGDMTLAARDEEIEDPS